MNTRRNPFEGSLNRKKECIKGNYQESDQQKKLTSEIQHQAFADRVSIGRNKDKKTTSIEARQSQQRKVLPETERPEPQAPLGTSWTASRYWDLSEKQEESAKVLMLGKKRDQSKKKHEGGKEIDSINLQEIVANRRLSEEKSSIRCLGSIRERT